MKRLTAFGVMAVLFAEFALAGPIVPKDISVDAKWFGHANFEAMRSMKLVQDLKDQCPVHAKVQAKMEEMSKKLGMNPLEDILGATLYSNCYGGQVGVVLIYVKKLDREKLVGLLKEKHPDHKTSQHGSRTLYSWTDKHHGKTMELTGAFAGDTLVVIGAGGEQVKAALDVIDGQKPGLVQDAPLLKDIPQTALFASRGLDVPEDYRKTTRCPVLRNCKSASAVWSEKDGQISGTYEFATVSEEAAKSFKAITDGFKAMGVLRFSNVPAAMKVVNGLEAEAKGDLFTATFHTTTADAESAIKAVMQQKRASSQGTKHHSKDRKAEGEKK